MSFPIDPRLEPFAVLGLTPGATDIEIDRASRNLLALLSVRARSASSYESDSGPAARDEALVRAAMSALRDPNARVVAEVLAEARELRGQRRVEASTKPLPEMDVLRVLRGR